MPSLRRFFFRLYCFFWPAHAERQLDREVASHLSLLAEEYRRRGMGDAEAQLEARRSIGRLDDIKDAQRAERSFQWLEDARRDMRYAVRTLGRDRTFAVVSVVTLALGIGATTAVFSVVHALLLRPLPYVDSDRLVRLIENVPAAETRDGRPLRLAGVNGPELDELQRHAARLSGIAGHGPAIVTVSGGGKAVRMSGTAVSPALFRILGARPFLGRGLMREDANPGGPNVIVLSHEAWRRHYGSDPSIVGRTLVLEGIFPPAGQKPFTVVGVMDADLRFPEGQAEFWVPSLFSKGWRPRVVARLAEGEGTIAAAAEVESVLRAFRGRPPTDSSSTPAVSPRFELVRARDELVATQRPALLVLAGAVALVLLIACVNVASLMLGRAAAREREFSIRIALGAGRGRLIRQLLTESLMLALAGGLLGTAVAWGGVRLLQTLGTTLSRVDVAVTGGLPRLEEVSVDGPVLLFSILISVACGLLFGVAPALRHARADRHGMLREGAPSGSGSGVAGRRRHLLIVAEVAMAAMLLVGGGLLINSLGRLLTVDLGYQPENLLTFQLALPAGRYPEARQQEFAEGFVARLQAVPGIRGVGYARQLPLVKLQDSFAIGTRPAQAEASAPTRPVDARAVSRDYLRVMGIKTIAGRVFEESDGAGRPRVLVVNDALARREFGGDNPVGRTVYVGRDPTPWEIVGVVANVRQRGLEKEAEPQFFTDLRQWPAVGPRFPLGAYYVVRTSGDPRATIRAIHDALSGADGEAGLENVATMEQLIVSTIWAPRLYAVLMGIFAGVAVALATVGIYGVVSYAVTRRTREIGVRAALGARPLSLLRLVLAQTMASTAWGMVLGIVAAAALARSLDRLLFGLTPLDPPTYVVVVLSLGAVAGAAALVPARRALAVDPLTALRHE
jgi:predicted permease